MKPNALVIPQASINWQPAQRPSHRSVYSALRETFPGLTPAERMYAQATMFMESRYARGWSSAAGKESHNWGATTSFTPGQGFLNQDTVYDNTGKASKGQVLFGVFPTDASGMQFAVRLLLQENVRSVLKTWPGDLSQAGAFSGPKHNCFWAGNYNRNAIPGDSVTGRDRLAFLTPGLKEIQPLYDLEVDSRSVDPGAPYAPTPGSNGAFFFAVKVPSDPRISHVASYPLTEAQARDRAKTYPKGAQFSRFEGRTWSPWTQL